MLSDLRAPTDAHNLLLSLLSASSTLAGLSLALTSIVSARIASLRIESPADDIDLIAACGFVIICYLAFYGLGHLSSKRSRHLDDTI
jgi:hypothetical protein